MVLLEDRLQPDNVSQVALDEDCLRVYGISMPLAQIIVYDHPLARFDQLLDDNAADVACPTGDQNIHFLPFSPFSQSK
jgi:hypothetical protein